MKHILIGFGYTASYVAPLLEQTKEPIEAYARQHRSIDTTFLTYFQRDIANEGIVGQNEPYNLYYFIPPPNIGTQDTLLKSFLQKSDLSLCRSFVYISSSAVYGDHQGAWVNEDSPCHIISDRQRRRLNAEKQILALSAHHPISTLVLRCAGIYGHDRIPIKAASIQQPTITVDEAPVSNLIYVNDLARIIIALQSQKHTGIFNIADGEPRPMGTLQKMVAEFYGFHPAPSLSYEMILNDASEMKRFFMESSKQLEIKKLRSHLPIDFQFTPISEALHNILSIQGAY